MIAWARCSAGCWWRRLRTAVRDRTKLSAREMIDIAEKNFMLQNNHFSARQVEISSKIYNFFSEFTEKLNWRGANERDSTELQHISPLSLRSAILIMSHLIKLRSRNQWESGVLDGSRPRVSEQLISRLMSSQGEMEIDFNEFMLFCLQLMRRNIKTC